MEKEFKPKVQKALEQKNELLSLAFTILTDKGIIPREEFLDNPEIVTHDDMIIFMYKKLEEIRDD